MNAIERIAFRVPALPVAQPRTRATSIHGHARAYQPTGGAIATFKATVRHMAAVAFKGSPLDGPLRVDIEFVFPRTKSQTWKTRPMPRIPHAKKPDRDNLDKAVLDALNGLLWVDDAQVCDGRLTKWIAAGDEQPHVAITVSRVLPVA